MGVKAKFMLDGFCIGYMNSLRDAEAYHRKLVEAGYSVQLIVMRSDMPDADIDKKKYRYVIDSLFDVQITEDIAEYFDFLLTH